VKRLWFAKTVGTVDIASSVRAAISPPLSGEDLADSFAGKVRISCVRQRLKCFLEGSPVYRECNGSIFDGRLG